MSTRPKDESRGRALRRGAYLLPSLLTIGNMFLAFFALVLATRNEFERAAFFLFGAAILDSLDGRVARSMKIEGEFGKQYDSLADQFSFGVVPALMAYFWGLEELGRIGWLIPFFYVVCAATRLARFNVQVSQADRRWFVGLPSPAAAGGVATVLFFAPRDLDLLRTSQAFVLATLVVLGALMLSTFRYYSFKELGGRRRWSYRTILPMLVVLLLAAFNPALFFLIAITVYVASGPLVWLRSNTLLRGRKRVPSPASEETP